MTTLILGLLLFLGAHSVRIVAEPWRTRTLARVGAGRWKAAYSVASLLGLALIVVGYGRARLAPVVLWDPAPPALRHVAGVLVLVALVLLVAAYVPGNSIKARVGHPMVAGVKTWAFAHLIANNTLADVLLFGGFLAWAIADFVSARRRDRAAGIVRTSGTVGATFVAVAVGAALWAALAFGGHAWLFGVRPFG